MQCQNNIQHDHIQHHYTNATDAIFSADEIVVKYSQEISPVALLSETVPHLLLLCSQQPHRTKLQLIMRTAILGKQNISKMW